ncbi:c-di-GMP-binding flagellar brake protein YcgR [Mobilisporobacter senegalensis]|uniref:C-di-GMP-binding flagellar brake protein YcgR n=1 Tax=Mobilisporobacter senegalensis TaxID=1329262 RepID=A0A3N1XW15_9FIRM|nr:flagellar brake protein [Mobilisporobacter senegalensis]ROR30786.1 c-di-GMP-binding flagellar brake protein YcgR [Mobilisporobacter senegalensis]
MLSNLISIGDKIDLRKKLNDINQIDMKQYVSQLLDFGKHEATIAMPIQRGKLILLGIGERYHLCFYTKKGPYQCDAVIVDRYHENNISAVTVQFLSDFEKFQRRQYYRLNYVMDIKYRIETENEREYINRIQEEQFKSQEERQEIMDELEKIQSFWTLGISNDISGGGIRFHSNHEENEGDRLRVKLNLFNQTKEHELTVVGLIKSVLKLINKSDYYEYRVEFIEIDYTQREEIIQFIFQEERKIRWKEKGFI